MTTGKRIILWSSVALLLILAGLFWFKFYFVFGRGVKAGELNQFTYKGYVWKTYEGKLIQAGFKGSPKTNGATIESYIFDFSVADEEVANELMHLGGRNVELHYKEYLGALPWRGMQKHVVDKVLSSSSNDSEWTGGF